MASLYRFRGLMVIALWQAAPVGVDEYGRTRIGFGLGAGTMEFTNYSCDGTLIDAENVGYTSAAVEAEHWVNPGKLRLHTSYGYQWSDSLQMKGPMGALMLSYEWRHFGIGAGPAMIPVTDFTAGNRSQWMPSLYIRTGNRDRVHMRAEVFAPGVQTSGARILLGNNQFDSRKPSIAVGYGMFGWEDAAASGAVVDFFHPISPTTALGFSGYAGPGEESFLAGLTLRARMTLK